MMTERVVFFQLATRGAGARCRRAGIPRSGAARPAKRGGVVGRMQSALATALKREPDIAEF